MNTKQSIDRLSYTISKGNKPNETDKIAFNKIISDVNKQASETMHENLLFAKLYAVMLRVNTEFHGCIIEANKDVNKILSEPLTYHLQRLEMVLKMQNVKNLFEHKNIVDPLLNLENFETYKNLFPEINAESLKYAHEVWNEETLKGHFTHAVNQSLITYKNV